MTGILLGLLIGLLAGATICGRYLRQEIAAIVGPRLRQVELQLDNIQAELNLATATHLADLGARRGQHLPLPPAR